jgi:hypothetical protein
MILVGYLVRVSINWIASSPGAIGNLQDVGSFASSSDEFQVIGYIIPGLIAIWFDRQGWIETLCALTTAAVVIRLVLILIYGTSLPS